MRLKFELNQRYRMEFPNSAIKKSVFRYFGRFSQLDQLCSFEGVKLKLGGPSGGSTKNLINFRNQRPKNSLFRYLFQLDQKSDAISKIKDPRNHFSIVYSMFQCKSVLPILGLKFKFLYQNWGHIINLMSNLKSLTRDTPISVFCSIPFH